MIIVLLILDETSVAGKVRGRLRGMLTAVFRISAVKLYPIVETAKELALYLRLLNLKVSYQYPLLINIS